MILTAAAMGWPCHLFLFHGALASYMAGTWDEQNITTSVREPEGSPESSRSPTATAPKSGSPIAALPDWMEKLQGGFETGNFPSLYEMLEKAAGESGGLKILACSTSCRLLELDLAAVREKVDEIVGLPTMMQIAGEVRHVLYL